MRAQRRLQYCVSFKSADILERLTASLSSFAKLIDNKEAAIGGQAESERDLLDVNHKSALNSGHRFPCTDACQDLVGDTDIGTISRDKTRSLSLDSKTKKDKLTSRHEPCTQSQQLASGICFSRRNWALS